MRRVLTGIAIAATGLLPLRATAETTYTCFGEPATVVGTPGDDDLAGDVVVGLAGSDTIDGRLVCAGKDNDRFLDGYAVNGGPGSEGEIYNRGPLAIGGSGNDKFWDRGGGLRQVWRGGEGNDTFIPGGGEDVFYGGAGLDFTNGGQPGWSEKLHQYGGPDNDQLSGGEGKDKIYGEEGDDLLKASYYGSVDTIPDLIDGGEGFDTCILQAGDRAVNCEEVSVVG